MFFFAFKRCVQVLLKRIVPDTEDCLGDYQYGFQQQLSIIGIIEKKYKYKQKIYRILTKLLYRTIHINLMKTFCL